MPLKRVGRAQERDHHSYFSVKGLLVAATVALITSACGGGGGSKLASTGASGTGSTVPPPAAASPAVPTVLRTDNTTYGPILTTAKGFALYTYTADQPGGAGCVGGCLQYWPPLLLPSGVTKPVPGPGVSGLGTFTRGGRLQVTYHGLPLYTYVTDKQPGQVTGQDAVDSGGKWLLATVAAPDASPATEPPTTAPPATEPPATRPDVTSPPATQPPATQPPATSPPATSAPATSPPRTSPPATSPPATSPPRTTPPATSPPTTVPPGGPSY